MTEFTIDLRYLAECQPSLCIPRVFNNIDEPRIRRVFDELGLGKIHHIDIVERKNEKGEPFKRVYIHFEKWFWNEDAQAARRKLISGKEIKIVYDNPWFWKASANKWAPAGGDRREEGPPQRSRPHIELDDSPRRERVVDEFGRNNALRKENNRREERPPRDERRPRDERPPRDERRIRDERPQERPNQRPQKMAAKTHIQREPEVPVVELGAVVVPIYTETSIPKKRTIQLKKKSIPEKPEKPEKPEISLEDGEIIEVYGTQMSEEEKKLSDDLYGDL